MISVISLLFAMMFKWLPDTKVEWRDVGLGAVLTAALFEVGKFLIGLYSGKQGLESCRTSRKRSRWPRKKTISATVATAKL